MGNNMGSSLMEAFSITIDGSVTRAANIMAPTEDYLRFAPHALLQNELFIFGGETDGHKIARLVGCEWTEISTRLINDISFMSAALSIEAGEKALICFDAEWPHVRCEVFDATSSSTVSTYRTKFPHRGGKLGFYKGNPTTVGSAWGDEVNKVETLDCTGWSNLTDFPEKQVAYPFLIGLPSGNLLLAGGYYYAHDDPLVDYVYYSTIWLLDDGVWRKIGNLNYADSDGSAIMIKNSIFIVSGDKSPHAIQRLDFQGDQLIGAQVIGYSVRTWIPVLYEVPTDYC